jgi:hypothetical protein
MYREKNINISLKKSSEKNSISILFASSPENVPLIALSSFPQPSWGVEGVEAAWRRRHFYQGYILDYLPFFNF